MSGDWETDPNFVNDVSEKEQRWGSKTVEGSGRQAFIDMAALRDEVKQSDRQNKLKTAPKPSFGYGGKFGVERDRMDKSAVGHDHHETIPKHGSQTDYSTGFGGKYGVQKDRQDKSAVNWDHVECTEKHASQKDYSIGFGGKFGVQKDRQDQSAVGWDHREAVEMHSSQKDYSTGFGGKYGVQTDRQDKSAVGWDYQKKADPHASQTDYSKGFGGKFGVQTDRMDSSSATWDQRETTELHPSQKKADVPKTTGGLSTLRERFESRGQVATSPSGLTAAQQRVAEERALWEAERNKTATMEASKPLEEQQRPVPQAPTAVPTPPAPEPVFPAAVCTTNTVTATEPESSETTPQSEPALPQCTAVAAYDYTADEDDELTFSVGELITEIEKIDQGWWKGVCRGKIGLFPANYVQEQ
ncbi:hypothetical protein PHET_01135 [Paragonimus heterotremus]|uniref:SH3 domain-containing protein n=1 Tax=Paragonimus heterotremus TaxID=100268 RepID=A0A8J4SU04_9TREM|nr:hypothetical protein PHET_01135 [Paragonimus heterotremus]